MCCSSGSSCYSDGDSTLVELIVAVIVVAVMVVAEVVVTVR